MSQLFLFVRPPRPLWPFNGPSTAFWPPLAFCSMAAALRDSIADLRVMIIDAPALRMGWKSLSEELFRLSPHFVAIGEEAVSCVEGLRLAKLAREVSATVFAGGCFFGNVAPEVLRTGLVDVVVHGEGEEAIVEVVQACRSGKSALHKVRGVSFLDGGEYVFTGWRDPIASLDDLPFPAFDLLQMQKYGETSRNHPNLVSIELSRGCSHECDFCVLWRQMGRHKANSTSAYLRTKSPERLLEEIRICTERFGRRYLGWVDPCFNASATVPRQLAELLLSRDMHIGQSAWVRADYIQRDLESGAFESCVRSGLNEVYLGLERHSDPDLENVEQALGSCTGGEGSRKVSTAISRSMHRGLVHLWHTVRKPRKLARTHAFWNRNPSRCGLLHPNDHSAGHTCLETGTVAIRRPRVPLLRFFATCKIVGIVRTGPAFSRAALSRAVLAAG